MWYIEISCRGPVGISSISIGVHIRNFSSVPISDILLPSSRGGDVYKACHRTSSNNSISSVVINEVGHIMCSHHFVFDDYSLCLTILM